MKQYDRQAIDAGQFTELFALTRVSEGLTDIAPASGFRFPWNSLGPYQGTYYRRWSNVLSVYYPSATTGTLAIKMPYARDAAMVTVTIEGYDSSTLGFFSLDINFYNYIDNRINNANVAVKGRARSDMFTVRFMLDGSNEKYIFIGTTASAWTYLSLRITDVRVHYSGNADDWGSGWTIQQLASETGYSAVSVTPTITPDFAADDSGYVRIANQLGRRLILITATGAGTWTATFTGFALILVVSGGAGGGGSGGKTAVAGATGGGSGGGFAGRLSFGYFIAGQSYAYNVGTGASGGSAGSVAGSNGGSGGQVTANFSWIQLSTGIPSASNGSNGTTTATATAGAGNTSQNGGPGGGACIAGAVGAAGALTPPGGTAAVLGSYAPGAAGTATANTRSGGGGGGGSLDAAGGAGSGATGGARGGAITGQRGGKGGDGNTASAASGGGGGGGGGGWIPYAGYVGYPSGTTGGTPTGTGPGGGGNAGEGFGAGGGGAGGVGNGTTATAGAAGGNGAQGCIAIYPIMGVLP